MRICSMTFLFVLALGCAYAEEPAIYDSTKFEYKSLHESQADAKDRLRCYQVAEDENATNGKSLAVALNKVLVRKAEFPILSLPQFKGLQVGTYRVTVRMKMQGMLNTLGTGIRITACPPQLAYEELNRRTRTVYLNEFNAEDEYQEFSLDVEICDPHIKIKGADKLLEEVKSPRNGFPEADQKQLEALLKNGNYANVEEVKKLAPPAQNWLNQACAQLDTMDVSLAFPINKSGEKATRGTSTPQSTLRKLFIDWIKVEKLPELDNITVRSVIPQYAWRRPGEPQLFHILMHNRSGKDLSGQLKLTVKNGLENSVALGEKPVEIKNGAYANIDWQWDVPKDIYPWGQEVVAEVVAGGKPGATARSWFTVHQRVTAVMIPANGSFHGFVDRTKPWRTEAARWHEPYASKPLVNNYCEFWAPTPYDSAGYLPENIDLPYLAGNSGDWRSIPELATQVKNNHEYGLASAFYCEGHGSSTKAMDLLFKNPEQVSNHFYGISASDTYYLGRTAAVAAMAKWLEDKNNSMSSFKDFGPYTYEGSLIQFNGLFPETVERLITEAKTYLPMVGWDGIRWDSCQPFRAYNDNILGQTFGKTEEELFKISVDNFLHFKAELRKINPNFEFRMNAGIGELMGRQEDPFDFAKARAIIDKDFHKVFLADTGGIEEEGWAHSYLKYSDYKYFCRNYLRAARFETAAYKYAGGHHAHMHAHMDGGMNYTPDCIYIQSFTLLGGAHMDLCNYGPMPDSNADLGIYAARFGEFFWDATLKPMEKIEDKLQVDSPSDIWSSEAGFERDLPNGNKQYVVMLINPPTTDTWLKNRYGQLPAPIRQPLPCTLKLPEGFSKVAGVHLLESSPEPAVKKLAFTTEGGAVKFEMPELVIFKVAVVEFAK